MPTELIDVFLEKIQLSEEQYNDYQIFFKKKMKQWNIKSPMSLSEKDKKKFYNEISIEWKKEKAKKGK